MSLSSDYYMATSLTADEIFALLRDNLDFVTGEHKHAGFRPALKTANDGLTILTHDYGEYETGIEEAFGFRPAVYVTLQLAYAGAPGFPEGMLNTVRTVNWLISHVEGDAAFIAYDNYGVLLRKDGKIWLDNKDEFWREEDLALLTFPYEWKKLEY